MHTASELKTTAVLIAARPDVVIMDINVRANSSIQGVRLIKKALPAAAIFMLALFYDEKKIGQSIRAGASGYILKKDSPKKIIEAINGEYKGGGSKGTFKYFLISRFLLPTLSAPPLTKEKEKSPYY